ncbi:MAG TPA: hypothetical protein VLB29_14855 [Nocardioidaceae bacterium]|nr:hypothetical protein [Nocardioidaceae bacterium]
MANYDARAEMVRTLLQKVEEDPYPSSTMLDMIEEMLTLEELPAYAEALLNRVRSERFPSIPMLNRLKNIA